jgi:integrase
MSQAINPRLARSTRSGNWEIAFSERLDGKTHSRRISTWTKDRIEAEAALTSFLTGTDKLRTSLSSPRVSDVLDHYEEYVLAERRGETQQICIRLLRRGFKDVFVSDLTPATILRYRQDRNVQSGTLRRELGTLRAALAYCKKHQLIKGDLPFIELPRKSQSKETYLTRSQAEHFLDLALAHSAGKKRLTRLTRFVFIALTTAARRDAILGLRWDRVDWDGNTINFQEPGEQLHNKRRVIVPISKRLRPILEQAYRERKPGNPFVLDERASIRKTWETWVKKTPYPHICPHDCRRTWATLAVQAGVSIVDVAAILGDSIEIVLKHYAKHVPGMAQKAVDTF